MDATPWRDILMGMLRDAAGDFNQDALEVAVGNWWSTHGDGRPSRGDVNGHLESAIRDGISSGLLQGEHRRAFRLRTQGDILRDVMGGGSLPAQGESAPERYEMPGDTTAVPLDGLLGDEIIAIYHVLQDESGALYWRPDMPPGTVVAGMSGSSLAHCRSDRIVSVAAEILLRDPTGRGIPQHRLKTVESRVRATAPYVYHSYRHNDGTRATGVFWDLDPELVACRNGLVNLRTGSFVDRPDDFATESVLPVSYAPGESSELFLDFLKGSLPDSWESALRVAAMAILPRKPENCRGVYLCLGDGSNGKSVFSKTIKGILGRHNYSSANPADLARNEHSKIVGLGYRALLPDELNEARLDQGELAALVKIIGTGADVEARPAHSRSPLKVDVDMTGILLVNRVVGDREGIMSWGRRIKILTWGKLFEGEAADPALLSNLRKDSDRIFSMLVGTLRGGFADNFAGWNTEGFDTLDDVRSTADERDSILDRFAREMCRLTDIRSERTLHGDVYGAYRRFCDSEGVPEGERYGERQFRAPFTERFRGGHGRSPCRLVRTKVDGKPGRFFNVKLLGESV